MIAVIFEFTAAPQRRQEYLDIAAALGAQVQGFDGFISIERFQSLGDPNRDVSLSFWRDEEAVRNWRNLRPHRAAQVLRDYTHESRADARADSRKVHG